MDMTMKNFLKYALLLLLLLPLAATAQDEKKSKEERLAEKQLAKEEKQRKELEAWEKKHAPKEQDIVYIFGVGTNFNDSTVYLTEVQPIHYLRLTKKYKFLPYRADFSEQLKDYLQGKYEMSHETTCIFYDTNRKKIARRFYKLKKRYLDTGTNKLIVVPVQDFSFQKPDYENPLF